MVTAQVALQNGRCGSVRAGFFFKTRTKATAGRKIFPYLGTKSEVPGQLREMRKIDAARLHVRAAIGSVPMACDSALTVDGVYLAALQHLGHGIRDLAPIQGGNGNVANTEERPPPLNSSDDSDGSAGNGDDGRAFLGPHQFEAAVIQQ